MAKCRGKKNNPQHCERKDIKLEEKQDVRPCKDGGEYTYLDTQANTQVNKAEIDVT